MPKFSRAFLCLLVMLLVAPADAAEKLRVSGYVRNLHDGRVEVFAMGTAEQLASFRVALQRGPRFSSVAEVQEEATTADPRYAHEFNINYDT